MSTPIQSGSSDVVAIHYSRRFPVDRTLCGVTERPMPATSRWAYVTCRACIEIGAADSQDARLRLEQLAAEARDVEA